MTQGPKIYSLHSIADITPGKVVYVEGAYLGGVVADNPVQKTAKIEKMPANVEEMETENLVLSVRPNQEIIHQYHVQYSWISTEDSLKISKGGLASVVELRKGTEAYDEAHKSLEAVGL